MTKLIVILCILLAAVGSVGRVRAAENLLVAFESTPFFNETNLKPGDTIVKKVAVTNKDQITQTILVSVNNVVVTPATSQLDAALTIKMSDETTTLVGPMSLKIFLTTASGFALGTLSPNETKDFIFTIRLPETAGNDLQNSSLSFDLAVSGKTAGHLVINEIFFRTDTNQRCPFGRILLKNQMNRCDDWVELYNPTTQKISLKNWRIVDGSGTIQTIQNSTVIKPNHFVLIAKSRQSLPLFWLMPFGTKLIKLKQGIGNGLSPTGDRLQLFNPDHEEVDGISWGTDAFLPHVFGKIGTGVSIQRQAVGVASDKGADFIVTDVASPGTK